jgi:hypothetical protein
LEVVINLVAFLEKTPKSIESVVVLMMCRTASAYVRSLPATQYEM